MSRCHLNEHAFYELLPVVLRTSHVGLEGNRFFPLEMKIFARQVRECNNLKLETIVLSGCQVSKNQLATGYFSHLRAMLPVSITGSDL